MMKNLFLLSLVFFAWPQIQTPNGHWLDVRDFGAKADCKADDSPAILAAVQAAIARGQGGGNVVYFPPTRSGCGYKIGSPLALPWTAYLRVTLLFDGGLGFGSTLTINNGYNLIGNSGGGTSFADDRLALFGVGNAPPNPIIHIQGCGIRLENIDMKFVHGTSNGILVDNHSCQVTLKNVWVQMGDENTKGVPLKIVGGFGYHIEGGSYVSKGAHAIEIDDDPRCNWTGIVRMRGTFLSGYGVFLNEYCGGINSLSFEDILFENVREPFLNVNALGGSGVWNIRITDVNYADTIVSGTPLINVKSPVKRVKQFNISNATMDKGPIAAGDPIQDLHVQ